MQPYVFQTTKNYASKICPGVTVTFRKMTEDRRGELQLAIIEPQTQLRELLTKAARLRAENKDETLTPAIMRVNDEIQMLCTTKLNPAKISWAVSAVQNLYLGSIDNPATMDNVMRWPSDLIEEILDVIESGTVMSEAEVKNSQSPITSGGVTGDQATSTTAPPAGETSDTSHATVASIRN